MYFTKEKSQVQTHGGFFLPFFPPPFITHFTFSKKFGLINYSGGNYNPLVLLQSSSEELRVLYKNELINCPSRNAGRGRLLSSEMGLGSCLYWSCGWCQPAGTADCQRDLPGHWVQGHQPILDIKVLGLAPLQATLTGQARPLS